MATLTEHFKNALNATKAQLYQGPSVSQHVAPPSMVSLHQPGLSMQPPPPPPLPPLTHNPAAVHFGSPAQPAQPSVAAGVAGAAGVPSFWEAHGNKVIFAVVLLVVAGIIFVLWYKRFRSCGQDEVEEFQGSRFPGGMQFNKEQLMGMHPRVFGNSPLQTPLQPPQYQQPQQLSHQSQMRPSPKEQEFDNRRTTEYMAPNASGNMLRPTPTRLQQQPAGLAPLPPPQTNEQIQPPRMPQPQYQQQQQQQQMQPPQHHPQYQQQLMPPMQPQPQYQQQMPPMQPPPQYQQQIPPMQPQPQLQYQQQMPPMQPQPQPQYQQQMPPVQPQPQPQYQQQMPPVQPPMQAASLPPPPNQPPLVQQPQIQSTQPSQPIQPQPPNQSVVANDPSFFVLPPSQ